tara:strand:+ start:15205 stop:15678 length:474 start_codon:yes stop_codon:yes gene_type:complete
MDLLVNYLKSIRNKLTIDNLMVSVVGRNKQILDLIVKLNTENQLFEKGIRSDGTEIEPFYSPFTVELKQSRGQRTDHVTLKDTGDFYNSFVAFVDSSKDIIIQSNPIKIDESTGFETNLIFKYGEKIEGLTQENINILNQKLLVPIQKYIKKIVFKI